MPIDAVAALVTEAGIGARRLREALVHLATTPATLDDLIRDHALPRRTAEQLLRAAGPDLHTARNGALRLPGAYRTRFRTQQHPRPGNGPSSHAGDVSYAATNVDEALTHPVPSGSSASSAAPPRPPAADPDADLALSSDSGVSAGNRALSDGDADNRALSDGDADNRALSDGDLIAHMARLIAEVPTDRSLDHVSATAETAARRARWLDETFDLAGAHLVCVGDHDLTSLAVLEVRPDLRVTVVDVDERLLEFIAERAARRGHAVDCWFADLRFGVPPVVAESADLVFTDPPYTPEGVQLFLGRGAQALRDRGNGRLIMAYGFSPLTPALGVKVQRAVLDLDLAVEAILPAFNRYHGAQAVGSASDLYVCRPTARTWQVLEKRLSGAAVNMYTHGEHSLEGEAVGRGPAALLAAPVRSVPDQIDLAGDPGPWLLRVLLALNAPTLSLQVPNKSPDLIDAKRQEALRSVIAAKYTLRYRRSTPSPKLAIVEATAVPGAERSAVGWLLSHAHGKLGNVLREGLVREHGLTKNQARGRIAELVPASWLDARLLDLPRHAITRLVEALKDKER
ncbi:bis-aminopropyl spermidine synthase family protein [Dactylosporangium aurantiacum]|uniref:bis-aminopropyl spermidine synthase family protein n=1 Tax=Dactylosporangium aurantiacum TaxID=35754 RepID=UPI0012DBDD8C|nr:bis-aminopropyl spermidine synthase family protein [Dactylosporangium aurantiacum]MDG6101594.1 bis-aminopropyl spermidine synthase family protein [Dactylosporangium aurantiacum]